MKPQPGKDPQTSRPITANMTKETEKKAQWQRIDSTVATVGPLKVSPGG
jgi:hypothetical protein